MLSIVLKISAWLNDYFLLYTFFLKIAMVFRLFYIYFMNRSTMCQFSKYVCAANLPAQKLAFAELHKGNAGMAKGCAPPLSTAFHSRTISLHYTVPRN